MLSLKFDGREDRILESSDSIKVESGSKLRVSVPENSSYQVLISDDQTDVILQVTNPDGSTYDVVLEGLASLYQSGDIVTQLLLDIEGEEMVVSNMTELFEALDATAAGEMDVQNRSFVDDNANIDPNRSAALDSDQDRTDLEFTPLVVYGDGEPEPVAEPVVLDDPDVVEDTPPEEVIRVDAPTLDISIGEEVYNTSPYDGQENEIMMYAYANKSDINFELLSNTGATLSYNPGNGLGIQTDGENPASGSKVIEPGEAIVIGMNGLVESVDANFKHAKGDQISWEAYLGDGTLVDSGTVPINNNDAAFTYLIDPEGDLLFEYLVISGTEISGQGKDGFNLVSVGADGYFFETYEYSVDLNSGLTDSGEVLSDITVTNVPEGVNVFDADGVQIDATIDGIEISYTVVPDVNGDATITLISISPISEEDLGTVTASVTSTESNGDVATVYATDDSYTLGSEEFNLNLDNADDDAFTDLTHIDLSTGDHTLSNLSIDDFLSMTSSDSNVLKVTGDSSDQVDLGLSPDQWLVDTTPTAIEIGYTTYTHADDTSIQLLIDTDIDVI